MHHSNAHSVWTDATHIITNHNAHCWTSVDRPLENIGFRYFIRIKLLPTFSYISIVVSARLGRFSQNGSHIQTPYKHNMDTKNYHITPACLLTWVKYS